MSLIWRIELTDTATCALDKLDPGSQRRIFGFLKEPVTTSTNPRAHGKALQGKLCSYWRYHVGAYRIEDNALWSLLICAGDRKDIYR